MKNKAEKKRCNEVTEKSDSEIQKILLLMLFDYVADFPCEKVVAFIADAEQSDRKEHRSDRFVFTREKNRSADCYENSRTQAFTKSFQHIVILSSEFSIFPII